MSKLFCLIMLVLLAACQSIPFKPVEKVPVGDVDPMAVRAAFAEKVPMDYRLVNSVVFNYGWKTFSGLGFLAVNQTEDSFVLTAMTPLAVKLFELKGDDRSIECIYAVDEFAEHEQFADTIGGDLYQIYFDLMPPEDAVVSVNTYDIAYSDVTHGNGVQYIFSGSDLLLTQKRYLKDDHVYAVVSYYEYELHEGTWYPKGIFYKHKAYHYTLTIRLKDFP